MKALFKLAIFLLVVNALYRFVPPYYNHTRLSDDIEQGALGWADLSEKEIQDQVLSLAHQRGLPVEAEQITVQRNLERLLVTLSYPRTLELVPGWTYEWQFDSNVEAVMLRRPLGGR